MLPAIKSLRCLLRLLRVLLFLLVTAPVSCWAENLKVIVLLSDDSAPYHSFANTLNKSLPASIQATVLEHPDQLSSGVTQAELIVAVGMKAGEMAAAQTGIPVLEVMVPQAGYEEKLAQDSAKKSTRPISAIYLDQPWNRQLDFLHAALPRRHRIGLLYSLDTRIDIERLSDDVAKRGNALVAQPVRSAGELFPQLEAVLTSSDVLLAMPDSAIYSSNNIRNILLTSYRLSIPLIGLSQAYVNAGALCAIFSTTEQIAEQAGATVISFAQTGRLPEPQYPAAFTIAVNQQVARSLGIELASPEVIRNRMGKEKEGGR